MKQQRRYYKEQYKTISIFKRKNKGRTLTNYEYKNKMRNQMEVGKKLRCNRHQAARRKRVFGFCLLGVWKACLREKETRSVATTMPETCYYRKLFFHQW